MSHPSRPRARGPAKRPRAFKTENPLPLEDRCLLAPYLPTGVTTPAATFTAATNPTTNANLGTVTVSTSSTSSTTTIPSQAPITSVTELTPLTSFGGDIVRLKAGPGGVFGNGLYAISRGGGSSTTAVNRPGVIYRIDAATGKASVFFDLNTVMNQLDPNALVRDGKNPAANSLGGASASSPNDPTGFKNWYDIAFDPEGNFNGQPTMFVSSVDSSDPAKNAIYMISPSGQFLGAFVLLTDRNTANTNFNINPTAMVVPGPQDQAFLRGLLAGSGKSTTNGTFAALFFNANQYSPGQTISNGTLPKGVSQTGMTLGPIAGMTQSNPEYTSPVYSAFTDFGTSGTSGIQGSDGELLIGLNASATGTSLTLDQTGAVSTQLRRLQDISFDQYGYFSQSVPLTSSTTSTTTSGGTTSTTTFAVTIPPNYGGSLFATDLAGGLTTSVTLTSVAEGDIPAGVSVTATIPVEGTTTVGLQKTNPSLPYNATTNPLIVVYQIFSASPLLGGRVIRVTPQGVVNTFAQGFHVAPQPDASSFFDSSLTLAFSADGTTLWVSDNDAIWQFKTTASLADSTSGTLIGLNDLRTFSVPYDGQNSAVAMVDTGVDGTVPAFRGRVTTGKNIWTGGPGNQDLASGPTSGSSSTGTTGTSGTGTVLGNTFDGHGTPVAGVVAQFVPQATIEPVAIFAPWFGSVSLSSSTTSGTSGTSSTGSVGTFSNALTTVNAVYQGMGYVAANPFVGDPVRPGRQNRVIASTFAFGTQNTYQSEVDAYRNYPQIVIALKNQLHKFRKLGIAPIAAAGQFGAPQGSSSSTSSTSTGTSSTTTTGGGFNNSNNSSLGDVNGMSLPAILNEAISVTGTYPFPFTQGASTTPNDPPIGVIPGVQGPVLVFGNALTIGGTSSSSLGFIGNSGGATTNVAANVTSISSADLLQYNDRILGSVNRSVTTDFAAPAIDVPTFRRRFATVTTSGGTSVNSSGAGDPANHMTFSQVGTSMSSAIVTGAYSMVASALDYWIALNQSSGVTSDAYLTTPVGVNTLSFGSHAFKDLSAYNNPDGINGILAYTAVPAADVNDSGSLSTPPLISTTDRQHHFPGSTSAPNYARVSIGNAIASIEGTIAINYLLAHNDFSLIDTNNDGLITAQEIQNFTDTAASKGLAEAGAMARLLGGTNTYAQPQSELNNVTFNENPDQPAALQRRFNYFDYLANGQLKGAIPISSFHMLVNTLLPQPDAYVIVDRQRASANGLLVAPLAQRNTVALQHKLPRFMFVPPSAIKKYRNISPARFQVNKNQAPIASLPYFSLFNNAVTTNPVYGSPVTKTTTVNGETLSLVQFQLIGTAGSSTPPSTTTTTTTSATTAAAATPSTTSAASTNAAPTTSSATANTPTTTTTAAQGTAVSASTGASAGASTAAASSPTTVAATRLTTGTSAVTTGTSSGATAAPSANSTSGNATTAPSTSSTSGTASSPNSLVQAIIDALPSTAAPKNVVPAGSVTPSTSTSSSNTPATATGTSSTAATATSATTASTPAQATATPATATSATTATTATPAATAAPASTTTGAGSSTGNTQSPAVAAQANVQQQAPAKQVPVTKKKKNDFWSQLIKPFK